MLNILVWFSVVVVYYYSCRCVQVELKHQYKVRIFMDESVSFGTLGATGHGVTEHLNVPVCLLLSLCYSIVYCYNGAQRYEQFLQVGRLYRALILIGLALFLPSASVSSVFTLLSLPCGACAEASKRAQ